MYVQVYNCSKYKEEIAMSENDVLKPINIRLELALLEKIDECRAAKREEMGKIPTRTDVIRWALDGYLKDCMNK